MALACACGQTVSHKTLLRTQFVSSAWGSPPTPVRLSAARSSTRSRRVAAAAAAAQETTPVTSIRRRSVSLFDALKFNGPAPELINGRLAMLGFLYAVKGEMETSETAMQLLQHGSPWQYALMALWIYASLVPITKGARHEAFGIFSPRAEITNGRAAMLGWAILLALEYKAGVPFF